MWRQAGVSLRPQTEADLPFVEELVIAVREDEPGFRHLLPDERVRLLKEQHQLQWSHYRKVFPAAHFLLILADGQPVGRFYLDHAADHLRVIELSILPDYQGHGIGRRLMETIQAEAARRRHPVRLSVVNGNPVERFYATLGFVRDGLNGSHLRMRWSADPRG